MTHQPDLFPETVPLKKQLTPPPGAGPLTTTDPAGWDMFDVGWHNLGDFLGLNGDWGRMTGFEAMGLGLAIQCADVKARDIAKLELHLLRNRDEAWNTVAPSEHWLSKFFVHKPNNIHTWGEFWRMVIIHLELAQNAYILIDFARDGTVKQLIPMMPARCRPRIGTNRRMYYEITAANEFEFAQLGGTHYVIVPDYKIIHLRGRMWDGLMGLSNLVLGHPLFILLNKISDYQTNLFGNDGKQPIAFETDQTFANKDIADQAFRRLKDQLTERWRRARAYGDPILLEAGLKAKPIAINSRDATTTETFNQQVSRICGLMMVPPHKIFHYESVKYDNQASADAQYANDCLVPIAVNIEEKLRNALLDEDTEWENFWPEFDREMMLAGDIKSLTERVKTASGLGVMRVDESRQRLGLNPLGGEGGKNRLVPVNTAQVDDSGEVVNQPAIAQPNNFGTSPAPAPKPAPKPPKKEGEGDGVA